MPKVYSLNGVIPVVDPSAYVHPEAVLIGDVIVGPGCYVAPCASLRGDFGQIRMLEGSNIQDNCTVHCFAGGESMIGAYANIGHGAVLHGCSVGDRALIGMNAVIMDGAVIGEEAIVAALSFVRAKFEVAPRTIVAGAPAKVLREVTDGEAEWMVDSNRDYHATRDRHRATLELVEALEHTDADGPAPGDRRRQAALSDPLGACPRNHHGLRRVSKAVGQEAVAPRCRSIVSGGRRRPKALETRPFGLTRQRRVPRRERLTMRKIAGGIAGASAPNTRLCLVNAAHDGFSVRLLGRTPPFRDGSGIPAASAPIGSIARRHRGLRAFKSSMAKPSRG